MCLANFELLAFSVIIVVLGRGAQRRRVEVEVTVVTTKICCQRVQLIPWKRATFPVPRDYTPTPHGPRRAALLWKWRRTAAWRRYGLCRYLASAMSTRQKRCNHSSKAARSTYRFVGLCYQSSCIYSQTVSLILLVSIAVLIFIKM